MPSRSGGIRGWFWGEITEDFFCMKINRKASNHAHATPLHRLLIFPKFMTSPQRSLHPASGNDRGSFLGALELVACGRMQLAQVVGAVVGYRVALEPSPQIFDRIEVGRVGWQVRNLDVTAQRVEIVAYEVAVVDRKSTRLNSSHAN